MTVVKQSDVTLQTSSFTDALRPRNLLNDFAELSALLLLELEKLAALSSEEHLPRAMTSRQQEPHSPFQARKGHLLDAFLLAAGMNQVLEDHLHRDVLALAKVSKTLRLWLPASFGKRAARGIDHVAQLLSNLRAALPAERRLIKQHQAMLTFVQQLADQFALHMDVNGSLIQEAAPDQQTARELLQAGRDLLAALRAAPKALRRGVMRLPAGFRSFDQRPEDCQRIIQKFAERWPERSMPLVVVGVRTSGSYLAPLYAAFLRAMGYERAQAWAMRPGERWLPGERDWFIEHVQPGGRVLMVDDPPVTGNSIAKPAQVLERVGIARQSISVVVPVFGTLDEIPPTLKGYDFIGLLFEEWSIHHQLAAGQVEKALADLLTGRTVRIPSSDSAPAQITVAGVRNVERLPLAHDVQPLGIPWSLPIEDLTGLQPFRGHVRGLYRVQLLDEQSGTWLESLIYAKGVGLGYFGAHSLALADALSSFLPEVYGLRDGLLYRAWLPDAKRLSRLTPVDAGALAEHIAAYVAAHRQSLTLPEDVTGRLAGRHTVWQRGNESVACFVFGRITPLVRPVLLGMSKYLLFRPVKQPAVIDGTMAPASWFLPAAASNVEQNASKTLLKVEFDDRVFCNQNLDCSDLFFDLASAAAYYELQTGDAAFSDMLRQRYAALTGETCSDERWLLYQLIALQLECEHLFMVLATYQGQSWPQADGSNLDRKRPSEGSPGMPHRALSALEATQRTLSRVQERYYGERFLSDSPTPAEGTLCAIDIDGVLETGWNPSVGITPAGALALRALAQHGYRPVIATGRCLDEMRERCQAYRLAGGMAEYGSVIYNHLTGETKVLLTPAEQADLEALRLVLEQMEGVFVSPAYRHSVRAYRIRRGERRALKPETIEQALQQVPGRERLRPIQGIGQTDFMVASIDKGTGLAALAKLLGSANEASADEPVLAFAAGDTISDLAMFRLARRAFAPANADEAVRAAAQKKGAHLRIMQRSHQAGLLQAVSQLLGHNPHRCSTCRPAAGSTETRLILTMFGARDVHKWGKLKQGALLAWQVALANWRGNR